MAMHNADVMRYQTAKFVQAMMSVHPELRPVLGLRIRRDHMAVPLPTRQDVDEDERAAKAAADAEALEKIRLIPVVSRRIMREVEFSTGVSVDDMKGKCRSRPVVVARQIAMWRLFKTGYGYSPIGRMFNRDHTTAIYGIRAIEAKATRCPEIAELLVVKP